MSSFIQKQNIFIKFILFLAAMLVLIPIVVILLAIMLTETDEDIPNWIFTAGITGSVILGLGLIVANDYNALQKLRASAGAIANNEFLIRRQMDHIMFQLNILLDKHVQSGKATYPYMEQGIQRRNERMQGELRTLEDARTAIENSQSLAFDNEVMYLFTEAVKYNEQLLRYQTEHNRIASEFNAGINSFPVKFFRNIWKFQEIPYFGMNTEKHRFI